jgi:hypothetical protein
MIDAGHVANFRYPPKKYVSKAIGSTTPYFTFFFEIKKGWYKPSIWVVYDIALRTLVRFLTVLFPTGLALAFRCFTAVMPQVVALAQRTRV